MKMDLHEAQGRIQELTELLDDERAKLAELQDFVEAERTVRQEAIDELELTQTENAQQLAEACQVKKQQKKRTTVSQ